MGYSGMNDKRRRERSITRKHKKTVEKTNKTIKRRIDLMSESMQRKRNSRLSKIRAKARATYEKVMMNRGLSQTDKYNVFKEFEETCATLRHSFCVCCRMTGLNIKTNKNGVCPSCLGKKNPNFYLATNALPVWYKDNIVQYEIPPELSDLTIIEKMLIQRISPFVPLHHIKNGTFGLSGHVCAFQQDIEGFACKLPRDSTDISLLKVVKSMKSEIGSDEGSYTKAFHVRKQVVYDALIFLKKYNPEYNDIEIDMSALGWISGDSALFDNGRLETDEVLTREDYTAQTTDMGPARHQDLQGHLVGDNVQAYGYVDNGGKAYVSKEDHTIATELKDTIDESPLKRTITMDWPETNIEPVNEFGDAKIFALAFPWLFPGGIGDVKDSPLDIGNWGKQLLYYKDGRFVKDKLFCFYAMNYIIRHRNSSSGRWFVNSFQQNCPDNLEELKASIQSGNSAFVNNLTYFNQRVKGSNAYWFKKRSELYTWINHHAEAGNGAPMFFITLSCAEYFWVDIIALLKERLDLAGEDSSDCYVGSPKLIQLTNDYTIVIQEYFQKRVEIWLNTVGKRIFGIKHYWVRYEFAPGRGQIHAHLLAIPEDQTIYELCHQDMKLGQNGKIARAEHLAQWASEKFGLTASVDDSFEHVSILSQDTPVQFRFSDIEQSEKSYKDDVNGLLKFCQCHDCSGFCMRQTKGDKCKKRTCKVGCGKEETLGKCDTPGFPLSDKADVRCDHRRSQRLYMPRNHGRLNQTSVDCLQSWRGNCDVQVIVYNCDPKKPDISEIARVTDYVVAYSCKGNCTLREEREMTKNMALNGEEVTGDRGDVRRLVQKCLNQAAAKRLISKQEAIVMLADLPLVMSSETIEAVSISNSKMIRTAGEKTENKTFIDKYKKRPTEQLHMSLYQFFHHTRNNSHEKEKRGGREIIPNFVGINGSAKFPVTDDYARATIIVYKPWAKYPNIKDWKATFLAFINSRECPVSCRMTFERVMKREIDRMTHYEPKPHFVDHSRNPLNEDDKELLMLAGMSESTDMDNDTLLLRSLPKGTNYKWDSKATVRRPVKGEENIKPEEWIQAKVVDFEDETNSTLRIPLKDDGTRYHIDSLYDDQKDVIHVITSTLKSWLNCKDLSKFKPLRMIVNGSGGSGKSVVINTLVTIMRDMFQCNDVIKVAAPTGTAAFNVGGETLHHLGGIAVSEHSQFTANSMSATKRKTLIKKFKTLLALVIDERSLLSTRVLGTTATVISETIFEGGPLSHLSFGGLPIVVLFGDDYQLPSQEESPLEALFKKGGAKMNIIGRSELLSCADKVMNLTGNKRMSDDKSHDKTILEKVRKNEALPKEDVKRLLSLHLDVINKQHGTHEVNNIKQKSIFLYYRNAPRARKNLECIKDIADDVSNPVAIIRPFCQSNITGKSVNKHYDGDPPEASIICRGASVALEGRNFNPIWGLHNGACGTVEEIVFNEGHNPNHGDLPRYAVVHFPNYCGPPWDPDNPKVVPIPLVSKICTKQCCTRTFLPITLAYARTIHKFQGLSAGPVDPGKIPNMYKCIVCDPDCKKWEGKATGLFYTAISRATTFGDVDGLNSAIYFAGSDFNEERICNIGVYAPPKKGPMINFVRRDVWVKHLMANSTKSMLSESEKHLLTVWCHNNVVPYSDLHARIKTYTSGLQTDEFRINTNKRRKRQ